MDLLNIPPHQISYGVTGKHFLFYGPPSTRKTTVAAMFPKSLLFATEIGYQFIPDVKAVNIDSWYTFTQAVRQLKNPQVRQMYDTIIIDTISLLQDMCIKYICDKHNMDSLGDLGFGKGWTDYRKELTKSLNYIAQLGYGIVFIDHSKEERADDGSIIAARPRLDNTAAAIVNALVDFTFFLRRESSDGDSTKSTVFAYSQLPSEIITKSRAMYMTKRFEFTFPNLQNELKIAVEKQMQELGRAYDLAELEKGESKYTPPKVVSIEELKEEITIKGKELISKGLSQRVTEVMDAALSGLAFAETTEVHRPQLLALNETFIEMLEE